MEATSTVMTSITQVSQGKSVGVCGRVRWHLVTTQDLHSIFCHVLINVYEGHIKNRLMYYNIIHLLIYCCLLNATNAYMYCSGGNVCTFWKCRTWHDLYLLHIILLYHKSFHIKNIFKIFLYIGELWGIVHLWNGSCRKSLYWWNLADYFFQSSCLNDCSVFPVILTMYIYCQQGKLSTERLCINEIIFIPSSDIERRYRLVLMTLVTMTLHIHVDRWVWD